MKSMWLAPRTRSAALGMREPFMMLDSPEAGMDEYELKEGKKERKENGEEVNKM